MASVEQTSQQTLYPGAPMPAMSQVAAASMPQAQIMQQGKARPRVSTTLWEDENTLCFQVEARGISVARREDNDMINGTKLLNVAGMTRGRRDGMLKAEKDRRVVKIGAMHLKGVWIPFDRAVTFAQKEGIADLLYPLFVEDIRSYLYRQTNPTGGAEIPLILPGEQKYSASPANSTVPPAAQSAPGSAVAPKPAVGSHQSTPQHTTPQPTQQQVQQQYNRQYPQSYVQPQYSMPGYGAAATAMQTNYPYQYSNYPQMMYPGQQQQTPQPAQQQQEYTQQQMYYAQQQPNAYAGNYDYQQQQQYYKPAKADRAE